MLIFRQNTDEMELPGGRLDLESDQTLFGERAVLLEVLES